MTDLQPACQTIVAQIRRLLAQRRPPILVALDGGSGSGKSTLAELIAQTLPVAWIPGDDFFAAGISEAEWDCRTAAERARDGIDWRRLRIEALEPLLAGRPARWRAFDFVAGPRPDGTYAMQSDYQKREPAAVILLDGAYSARPELADLITLSVLLDVPPAVRHARLVAREEAGFLAAWHARWDGPEAYYFSRVRPPESFDLVVGNG